MSLLHPLPASVDGKAAAVLSTQARHIALDSSLLCLAQNSRPHSARAILLHLYRRALVILLIAALEIKFCWDGSGPKH